MIINNGYVRLKYDLKAKCHEVKPDSCLGLSVRSTDNQDKKIWFLGVNVSPAGQSLSQNTDGINETTASYPITIKGTNLKAVGGTDDFVDVNGNTIKVFKVSSVPTDDGYATFLDSVPVPTELKA